MKKSKIWAALLCALLLCTCLVSAASARRPVPDWPYNGDYNDVEIKPVPNDAPGIPEKVLYKNTITSFGPCMRDISSRSEWYRVTPLDLHQEGAYEYPLIASNKYTIGMAVVEIMDGTITVTYQMNKPRNVDVISEKLCFYPDAYVMETDMGKPAYSYRYGEPIDILEAFGDDQYVILSMVLKANYAPERRGVHPFRVDQTWIDEMLRLLD